MRTAGLGDMLVRPSCSRVRRHAARHGLFVACSARGWALRVPLRPAVLFRARTRTAQPAPRAACAARRRSVGLRRAERPAPGSQAGRMRAQPALLHDLALKALPDWWERIDDDPNWQKYSFTALAVGYGALALVALVQLIRIQRRVPQFGWTTQKVFHLLNAFVCILRCVVLAMRDQVRPPLRARPAPCPRQCVTRRGEAAVLALAPAASCPCGPC